MASDFSSIQSHLAASAEKAAVYRRPSLLGCTHASPANGSRGTEGFKNMSTKEPTTSQPSQAVSRYSADLVPFTETPMSPAHESRKRGRTASVQEVGGVHTSEDSEAESMGTTQRRVCSPQHGEAAARRRATGAAVRMPAEPSEEHAAARQYAHDMVRAAHGQLLGTGNGTGVSQGDVAQSAPQLAQQKAPVEMSLLREAAVNAAAHTLLAMQPLQETEQTYNMPPVVTSGNSGPGSTHVCSDPVFRRLPTVHTGQRSVDGVPAVRLAEAPTETMNAPVRALEALLRAMVPRPLSSAAGHVAVVAQQWPRRPQRSSHLPGTALHMPPSPPLRPKQSMCMALMDAAIRTAIGPDPNGWHTSGTVPSVTSRTRASTAENNHSSSDLVAALAALPAAQNVSSSSASTAALGHTTNNVAAPVVVSNPTAPDNNLASLFQSIAAVVPKQEAQVQQQQPRQPVRQTVLPPLEHTHSSCMRHSSSSRMESCCGMHRLDTLATVAAAAAAESSAAAAAPAESSATATMAANSSARAQGEHPAVQRPNPMAARASHEQEQTAAMAVASLLAVLKQEPARAAEVELPPTFCDLRPQVWSSPTVKAVPTDVHRQQAQHKHFQLLRAAELSTVQGAVLSCAGGMHSPHTGPAGHSVLFPQNPWQLVGDFPATGQIYTAPSGKACEGGESPNFLQALSRQPSELAGNACIEADSVARSGFAAAGEAAGQGRGGVGVKGGVGGGRQKGRPVRTRVTRLVQPMERLSRCDAGEDLISYAANGSGQGGIGIVPVWPVSTSGHDAATWVAPVDRNHSDTNSRLAVAGHSASPTSPPA
jgi:hypothetical protein